MPSDPLAPDLARSEESTDGDLSEAAAVFTGVRPRLFGIAYRMLASVSEAEDIVQEVWLRWQGYDRSTVREPGAFLAKTTTRLCINEAQSARARRETYVGPWLPEPVDTAADPLLGAVRGEALEFAILLLLEKLSPPQRAAYVLREAFDYPYDQIADIVQLSEANVRQLVSRARKRLAEERREPVSRAEQNRLLTAFLAAAQQGDLSGLEKILAEDAVNYSDGGGRVRASRFPVLGRLRVAKFIAAFCEPLLERRDRHPDRSQRPTLCPGLARRHRDGSDHPQLLPRGVNTLMWIMNPTSWSTSARYPLSPQQFQQQPNRPERSPVRSLNAKQPRPRHSPRP